MNASVEIPVEVTAWVDERVVPLVVALNELDDVVTVGSRQGGPGRPAYVRFRRRDGDVAELAVAIAGLLAAHAGNIGYQLRTLQRGRAGVDGHVLELACGDHQVMPLALCLRASSRSRPRSRPADVRSRATAGARPLAPMAARPRRRLRALATG